MRPIELTMMPEAAPVPNSIRIMGFSPGILDEINMLSNSKLSVQVNMMMQRMNVGATCESHKSCLRFPMTVRCYDGASSVSFCVSVSSL